MTFSYIEITIISQSKIKLMYPCQLHTKAVMK